jgi:mRNA interferase RelE/StbE
MYKTKISDNAEKQLSKLDKPVAKRIRKWLEEKIDGSSNPRIYGKPLTGTFKGLWRYRVGDYRILADVQDDIVTVLIVEINHRREVYG